jgi:hypothetical protein
MGGAALWRQGGGAGRNSGKPAAKRGGEGARDSPECGGTRFEVRGGEGLIGSQEGRGEGARGAPECGGPDLRRGEVRGSPAEALHGGG